MRIVVICGAGYISGKEKIMYSLLKGFDREGDDVFCITSTWGNGQFEDLLVTEQIKYAKIRLGFISKTWNWKAVKMTLEQFIYWPKLLFDYYKIIRSYKPDVIIHTNFHHLFLLFPVIQYGNAVHVYHSHESISNTKFYQKMFTRFQKKIKLFVGVSEYVTTKLTDLGISRNKAKTIYNGLENMERNAMPGITDGIFRMGIVGQVGAWKGHEDLILAAGIIRDQFPGLSFKLCIFGEGKPEIVQVLKELIHHNRLDEFVEWKGFVTDIKNIYPGLQVVCIPSRSEEPLATSALEAGLFALPVIVSSRGGFPEIVKHEYSGFIVAPHAPEEIAHWIGHIIEHPEQARQTGINHQRTVTQMFSYKNFISNWKSTLSSLIP